MAKKKKAKKKVVAKKSTASTKTASRAVPVRKTVSLIGIDPLAWIKDEAEDVEPHGIVSANSEKPDVSQLAGEEQEDKLMATINLNERFSIRNIADIHTRLREIVKQGTEVKLNFIDIDVVDTAALQLLTAFTNAARQLGVSVVWENTSETLYHSAELLGLASELDLPKH